MSKGNCKDCHFYKSEKDVVRLNRLGDPYRNPCVNISVSGWDYWQENGKEPEDCEAYCRRGEYKPTGIWAELAGVLEKIEEDINHEN